MHINRNDSRRTGRPNDQIEWKGRLYIPFHNAPLAGGLFLPTAGDSIDEFLALPSKLEYRLRSRWNGVLPGGLAAARIQGDSMNGLGSDNPIVILRSYNPKFSPQTLDPTGQYLIRGVFLATIADEDVSLVNTETLRVYAEREESIRPSAGQAHRVLRMRPDNNLHIPDQAQPGNAEASPLRTDGIPPAVSSKHRAGGFPKDRRRPPA